MLYGDDMALTKKQQAFIAHYFECGMNASEAARRAGYSADTAYSIGSRLLKDVEVLKEVERLYKERTMPADEILARLTDHARGDIGDIVDDNGVLDIKKARAAGKTALIKKIKRTTTTYTDESGNGKESYTDEIEFHDPQKAMQLLGKFYKLFIDRQEVTGKDGGTVKIQIIRSDESDSHTSD